MTEEPKANQVVEGRQVIINVPPLKSPKWMQGFLDFIRHQGVVGLSVGLVIGIASKSLVDSLVNDIFNPIIGLVGGSGGLDSRYVCLKNVAGQCTNKLAYGALINSLLSFIIIVAAVYFVIKGLKLDKLDKPKAE